MDSPADVKETTASLPRIAVAVSLAGTVTLAANQLSRG